MATALQDALGPYLRSREDVLYVRRVLAVHLNQCLHNEGGHDPNPLALGPSPGVKGPRPSVPPTATGLQKDYLKAVSANMQAQEEYEAMRSRCFQRSGTSSASSSGNWSLVEVQMTTTRLQQKRTKLEIVERYFDQLGEKPAANPGFMTAASTFEGSSTLPAVPKEVMQGITREASQEKTELEDVISRVERSILDAKMLRRKEEQHLAETQRRTASTEAGADPHAKLQALDVVRNELISWIETKLGHAATEDVDDAMKDEVVEQTSRAERLAEIREKYDQYVSARKSLLQLVSRPPPKARPVPGLETDDAPEIQAASSTPETLHLIPYLETLLATAHQQKGLISQKGHANVALSKQLKEGCLALDHLAEESQLLPRYLGSSASRRKGALGESSAALESLSCTAQVKPWVYAADSAKIATLEAVTEKIEDGQIALEHAMGHLSEADRLLAREATEEDEESQPTQDAPNKHVANTAKSRTKQPADSWATLRGDLGLLNPGDSSS